MRTGRPKQPLILTEEERERLESLAHRARSQALLARRARVVLACAEGLENQAVARKLRCSLGMVGKWRARFLKGHLEALYDEPRPGTPRTWTGRFLGVVASCARDLNRVTAFKRSLRDLEPAVVSPSRVWLTKFM